MKKQFILFAMVGAIATLTQYTVLVILVEALSMKAIYASSLGYVLGAVVNYGLNRKHTFQSNKAHHKTLFQFTAVFLLGLTLNGSLMGLLTEKLGLSYIPSQILVTGFLLGWNFMAHRHWTFRERIKP